MRSFLEWLQKDVVPEPDYVLPVIRSYGSTGITRQELGKIIEIDGEILDEFLGALADLGFIKIDRVGGEVILRVR